MSRIHRLPYLRFCGTSSARPTGSRGVGRLRSILATARLARYVDYARSLARSDLDWPEGLELPSPVAPLDSYDGRVNNPFFGALAWIMLHEIAHILNSDIRLLPPELRRSQEFRADAFATDWILDEAGQAVEREFRVLAITTARSWLFLHEHSKGPGHSHPPALERFRQAVHEFQMSEQSVALESAAYMLKAVFDPASIPRRMSPRKTRLIGSMHRWLTNSGQAVERHFRSSATASTCLPSARIRARTRPRMTPPTRQLKELPSQ